MKVSLSWLKELVSTDFNVEQIAESLSIAGFEVEDITDLAQGFEHIVIGRIEEISKHPNANKLKVCKVLVAGEQILQIVCGASNVREGIHVLVAREGAFLPKLGIKIKSSELRGIQSEGMICSLDELGLQSKCDGIAIIEEILSETPLLTDDPSKLLGLNDVVLDFAITANRPDGMSMLGIARELSAITGSSLQCPHIKDQGELKLFKPDVIDQRIISSNEIYTINYIEGVNGRLSSPSWLKDRLKNAGINSINAVIDITNYVMVEYGQPLHAFDADLLNKLLGRKAISSDFGIRMAKNNEEFLTLDGNKHLLSDKSPVITCGGIPIAIAGISGGLNSGVNLNTKNIWLEAAVFTSPSIRISSRDIGIRTESSSRYEKGISPLLTIEASNRAIDLLDKVFKCKLCSRWTTNEFTSKIKSIKLRRNRLQELLGLIKDKPQSKSNSDSNDQSLLIYNSKRKLHDHEITDSLKLLGCIVSTNEDGWDVKVPPNRCFDLTREIDLVEEVARLVGYDKFDVNLPEPLLPGGLTANQKVLRLISNSLSNLGFYEVVTYSLVGAKKNETLIPILNPLLAETSHLRLNLWEEHLLISKRNIHAGRDSCWIYEIAKIYIEEDSMIVEKDILSGLLTGDQTLEKWSSGGKQKELGYYKARGKLSQLLEGLKLSITDIPLINDDRLHPGRASTLILEGRNLGCFGQIHPKLSKKLSLNSNTFIFDIDLKKLLQAATRKNKLNVSFKEYPTVPYMQRDIACIVSKDCVSSKITKHIQKLGSPLLENAELIDRFESDIIGEGKVSLAFRLTYRDKKDTLKEKDINPLHTKIQNALTDMFDAEIRK
ncbi:phenylalanine--tRNA ligase subunit beta [Prochlorococcus sp. MIT 0601]|uniref:phenylalanine--tRNA ligase subunit beta n=1 Tax=Prochlorococcus sp. MIT 0601 TaxID=1499498 RepID=UPI000533975F|nr:phenylalanine--tRNA ligase subunit beta [Prochlorococcus sp. MIT 0601]KGG12423.1 Phenylalanyl-tRNA synthetase beta chain [Prochlorococcus sp. MIT 0601]